MSDSERPWRVDRALSGGNRILAAEIEELASRSSGPGGQHVNTSSTRVSLRWNLRTSQGLKEEARQIAMAPLDDEGNHLCNAIQFPGPHVRS